MSLITSLLGRKPVEEFTGCGAVPANDGGAAPVMSAVQPKIDPRRRRLRRRLKEDGALIPDDAEKIDANHEEEKDGDQEPAASDPIGSTTEKLPTSLALVAPDCTPGWNIPLSPTQLPAASIPSTQAVPDPGQQAADKPFNPSVSGSLKLAGSGAAPASQDLKTHAESLAASVAGITEDVSGEALLGRNKPMPDHVQGNSALNSLKRYRFGA